MSDTTNIAWCDSTWNPWVGCEKVSDGCKHCYAESLAQRFGKDFSKRSVSEAATFNAPLKWRKKPWVCENDHPTTGLGDAPLDGPHCDLCGGEVHRRRVFLGSMMDWLDTKISIDVFAKMLDIVRRCPELDFLCVTKRPELWRERLNNVVNNVDDLIDMGLSVDLDSAPYTHWEVLRDWLWGWLAEGETPSNVWIIASVENQAMAEKRIPELLKIPAVVRGLSIEPMLGPIDISRWIGYTIPNENKHCGRTANSGGCSSREIQNRQRGPGLEGASIQPKGGAQNPSGLYADTSDGKRCQGVQRSAQNCLPITCRPDSTGANHQSHKRGEGGQSTGKLGGCNLQPAVQARFQNGLEKSGRGEEPGEQAYQRSSGEHSGRIRDQHIDHTKNACGQIRGIVSGDFKDCSGGAPKKAGRHNVQLCFEAETPGVTQSVGQIHFVIFGGESGPGSRPCNVEWIRDGIRQCKSAGVPCFVKQLGTVCITDNANMDDWPNYTRIIDQGIGCAGRVRTVHSKGGDPVEWPKDLRVRQFPKAKK